MKWLIRSRLIWIYTVCKCVSEFTCCPNIPDCTLHVNFFSFFQKRTGGDGSENAAGFANLLLIGLATFSTAYNVILYVVFNPTFKRAIHDILKCAKSDMVRLELNDGVTPSPQECDDGHPVATYTSRIFTVKSHAAT